MGLLDERMRDPRHLGAPEGAHAQGSKGNPACGDIVTIHLRVEGGRIVAAGFDSIGSAYQLATADVLCDCVTGETLEEAAARGPECVLKRLPELPERHRYLARLAVEALERAIGAHARGERPGEEEPLDEEAAKAFVMELLGHRAMTGREVEAMAKAEGVALPGGAPRFLARLRKQGEVEGEMDVRRRTWRWWKADGSAPG